MGDLMSNDNCVVDPPNLNKSLLGGVYVIKKVRLVSIGKSFGNDFVNNIIEANRTISRYYRHRIFRNYCNISVINIWRKYACFIEVPSQHCNIVTNP